MKLKTYHFIKISFYLFLCWFICDTAYVVIDGLTDSGKQADVAVILGTTVNEDGTLSERLEKRVECGLALYKSGRVKSIIVSGGLGKEGFWEGDKMKEYLVLNGVPDSCVVADNYGNNTELTVINTLKLRERLNFASLLVVSQYFHVTRTKMLFKKHNFQDVSSVSPTYFELRDLYSLGREFFAYYAEKF